MLIRAKNSNKPVLTFTLTEFINPDGTSVYQVITNSTKLFRFLLSNYHAIEYAHNNVIDVSLILHPNTEPH